MNLFFSSLSVTKANGGLGKLSLDNHSSFFVFLGGWGGGGELRKNSIFSDQKLKHSGSVELWHNYIFLTL